MQCKTTFNHKTNQHPCWRLLKLYWDSQFWNGRVYQSTPEKTSHLKQAKLQRQLLILCHLTRSVLTRNSLVEQTRVPLTTDLKQAKHSLILCHLIRSVLTRNSLGTRISKCLHKYVFPLHNTTVPTDYSMYTNEYNTITIITE